MTTRRQLLAGLGACACHPLFPAQALAKRRTGSSFLCAVVDSAPIGSAGAAPLPRPNDGGMAPMGGGGGSSGLSPYGTIFAADAWRRDDSLKMGGDLIVLGVHFLDGGPGQIGAFKRGAKEWLDAGLKQRLDFDFSAAADRAQIRVTFDTMLYWAAIGRNALTTKGPTIRLGGVEPRAVLHELGHVFGLQHEHLFPGGVQWNTEAVIADAKQRLDWEKSTTEQEILRKLGNDAVCLGDGQKFNKKSIMSYPIPAGWARYQDASGRMKPLVIEPAEKISSGDVACLKGIYDF